MAVDLDSKATKDLETLVANCVRLNRTADPMCVAANAILETRRTGEYNLEKTIAVIRRHGELRSFLSYKDVSDASGLNWLRSRNGVGPHLDAVSVYTNAKGWPFLTSIVVHKDKVSTGEMAPANLKGFRDAVHGAGHVDDDVDAEFVKREQQRVFAWCRQEHETARRASMP